jgi:hypothetical protein
MDGSGGSQCQPHRSWRHGTIPSASGHASRCTMVAMAHLLPYTQWLKENGS